MTWKEAWLGTSTLEEHYCKRLALSSFLHSEEERSLHFNELKNILSVLKLKIITRASHLLHTRSTSCKKKRTEGEGQYHPSRPHFASRLNLSQTLHSLLLFSLFCNYTIVQRTSSFPFPVLSMKTTQ